MHDDQQRRFPLLEWDRNLTADLRSLRPGVEGTFEATFLIIRLRLELEIRTQNAIHVSLFIFEITDTGTPDALCGYKRNRREESSMICADPHIDRVEQYLTSYERLNPEVNGDRVWPYLQVTWARKACDCIEKVLEGKHQYVIDDIAQLESAETGYGLHAITKSRYMFYLKNTDESSWNEEVSVTKAFGEESP